MPLFWILKEFDPIAENESETDPRIASIDVRMPTNAVIPIATISAVRNVRSLFALIECNDSFTLSRKDIFTGMEMLFAV